MNNTVPTEIDKSGQFKNMEEQNFYQNNVGKFLSSSYCTEQKFQKSHCGN